MTARSILDLLSSQAWNGVSAIIALLTALTTVTAVVYRVVKGGSLSSRRANRPTSAPIQPNSSDDDGCLRGCIGFYINPAIFVGTLYVCFFFSALSARFMAPDAYRWWLEEELRTESASVNPSDQADATVIALTVSCFGLLISFLVLFLGPALSARFGVVRAAVLHALGGGVGFVVLFGGAVTSSIEAPKLLVLPIIVGGVMGVLAVTFMIWSLGWAITLYK